LQELDHVSIMKPITKFAATVPHTQRIPEIISMAFREAYNGRPGPSFLEIPRDVLDAKVDLDKVRFPEKYRLPYKVHGDPKAIELAASWFQQAERPARLAGSQVRFCRGAAALAHFAERARVPIYVNGAARGALPPTHPNLFVNSRRQALGQADVIMIIGTLFDFRLGYGQRLNPQAKVIQVDLDYGELGHNRDVDLGICGDAAAILTQLTDALGSQGSKSDDWLRALREVEEKSASQAAAGLNSDQVPIHPLRLCKEINDFLTEDTIFIGDGGDIVTMSASVIRTHKPGHWLDPGPLGTLGVGAPFAIAAKTAMPDKEVFILFGDGAFGLTGFDIDTAVRFGLPFVSVVGNNAGWNQIRFGQLSKYGEKRGDVANKLSATRYDVIVEAMGGYGELVTQPQDIRPAMERARASGKPSCVNVILDPDIYSSGTMNQTMYK
jgi:acetolactate synthase I/II/III large subunit